MPVRLPILRISPIQIVIVRGFFGIHEDQHHEEHHEHAEGSLAALSLLPSFEGRLVGAGVEGVGDRDVGVVGEVEVEVHAHRVGGEGVELGWARRLGKGIAIAMIAAVVGVVVDSAGIITVMVVVVVVAAVVIAIVILHDVEELLVLSSSTV